jgi:signal transduction histidine kinase
LRRIPDILRHPIDSLRSLSIRSKITLLTLSIALFSVFLASAIFSGYQYTRSREGMETDVNLIASLVGDKSAAALEFEDAIAAEENLQMLGTQPNIVAAAVYRTSGSMLAAYTSVKRQSNTMPRLQQAYGFKYESDVLTLYRPIFRNGEQVGTIGIRSDLGTLNRALVEIFVMFVITLLTISGIAYLLASRTRHYVADPIMDLTNVIRSVTEKKDYGIRAERKSQDEVGYLVDQFNQMLSMVQRHQTAIRAEATIRAELASRKREEVELRRLNDRLERSNRDLEDFASIASHDLQEPLRKVLAFGDRLVSSLGDSLDPRSKDYLARMMNATVRMQTLINDLLQYSRVSTRAQPFVNVNLNSLICEIMVDLETRIESSHGRIQFHALPTVVADPAQMRQLFQNLLGNALKYHRPDVDPVVTIDTRVITDPEEVARLSSAHARILRITVSDNGIGFDDKYSEQIFAIFHRLHGRSEYEGTGIGLAICKKIVERHGGTIKAKGIAGAGAQFTIDLPHEQHSPGTPDEQPVPVLEGGQCLT